jgi:acetate kinase
VKVLVLNCGSSSIKLRLFEMGSCASLARGTVERIGEPSGRVAVWHTPPGAEETEAAREGPVADHAAGLRLAAELLRASGALSDPAELHGIGHRVVHGGERFRAPALIDPQVLAALRAVSPLAPLHNPPNLLGIEVAMRFAPSVPQVAVFDTAFHQRMPPRAYLYALPYALYTEHGVRRYGFHGTSHAYVAAQAADYLGRPIEDLSLVTLHLGNGASAAAVQGGHSIDTSMGMTPLEGLVMGTRSGDMDPAIAFFLERETGASSAEVERLLNAESGLKGLCGVNDMREVLARAERADARARLALDVTCYRLRKYIGAYWAAMGRLDAIVFTGGIGENAPRVRAGACAGLEGMGVVLDPALNAAGGGDRFSIDAQDSRVRVLVVRTDEELAIARQTVEVIEAGRD